MQGSESAVNQVLLLAMAVFFLVSMETRVKRHRALAALHRLRSIVHIVDMHQLTKDPEMTQPAAATPASPERPHTPFELGRYLDYCSELFSLTSKVAALYGQSLKDPVVLEAVSDIETLAASLSNKVWQKIVVLARGSSPQAPVSSALRARSPEPVARSPNTTTCAGRASRASASPPPWPPGPACAWSRKSRAATSAPAAGARRLRPAGPRAR